MLMQFMFFYYAFSLNIIFYLSIDSNIRHSDFAHICVFYITISLKNTFMFFYYALSLDKILSINR
jgi:hypothetical protein